jgi:hypothetical protein
MIRNTKITLNIFWDDVYTDPPELWNWTSLCDLDWDSIGNQKIEILDVDKKHSGRTISELLDGHTLE